MEPSNKLHIKDGNIRIEHTAPQILFHETGVFTDKGKWTLYPDGEEFLGTVVNDAETSANCWLRVKRTGTDSVDSVNFENGNVGIGTTTPNSKLQVDGAITPASVPSRSGATINASDANVIKITGSTDIVNLTNGVEGQVVVLFGLSGNRDVKQTGNIKLNDFGDLSLDVNENLTLLFIGSTWYETSYSTP